ncbi:hypothetical protein ON010_g11495 [Phytophthora cinnamomi]|nr:hypothetical protein ON010_g11495 [Phytophthora cinnamomi]
MVEHETACSLCEAIVADDLKLDPSVGDNRDQVLALGKKTEGDVLAFLGSRNITSRGSTTIRKHLHEIYTQGDLNGKSGRHQQL